MLAIHQNVTEKAALSPHREVCKQAEDAYVYVNKRKSLRGDVYQGLCSGKKESQATGALGHKGKLWM